MVESSAKTSNFTDYLLTFNRTNTNNDGLNLFLQSKQLALGNIDMIDEMDSQNELTISKIIGQAYIKSNDQLEVPSKINDYVYIVSNRTNDSYYFEQLKKFVSKSL